MVVNSAGQSTLYNISQVDLKERETRLRCKFPPTLAAEGYRVQRGIPNLPITTKKQYERKQ